MALSQLEHATTPRSQQNRSICILACGVQLPENMGSLLRLADAFGVHHLYFTASTHDIEQKKVKRVSRSTIASVNWSADIDPFSCLSELKKEEYTIIALELTSQSIPLKNLDLHDGQKVCLVIGSEKAGINDEVLNQVDCAVYIPMHGENSSMNVAQACAIGLYQLS